MNTGIPTSSSVTSCLRNTLTYPISLNHSQSVIKLINSRNSAIMITINMMITLSRRCPFELFLFKLSSS